MKILHMVFHPNLAEGRVNKTWTEQLAESGKITTSRDMYAEYPDFNIDVEKEQALLLEHDRIVLQFPLYWYSMPPLMKKWLDDVITFGYGFGPGGDKLQDKDMQVIVSVGGRAQFYSGFDIFSTIPDLLRPFHLTANLCQMNYMVPVWMHRADLETDEVIRAHGQQWVDMIDDPARSDARNFLINSSLDEVEEGYAEAEANA